MRGCVVAGSAVLLAVLATGCDGCAPQHESPLHDAAFAHDAALSGGSGGAGGLGGSAAAGSGGAGPDGDYRVAIRASKTVLCPGECTELSAEAVSGQAPYEYAWSDGIGTGAGPHTVCPRSTATFTVTARDTAIDGEFGRPSRSTEATIGIVVDASDARGCTLIDAGPHPDGGAEAELCTIEVAYEEPDPIYVIDSVDDASTFATDADGNVYLAGTFTGRIDLGDGFVPSENRDGFIAKYDSTCSLVWSRTFGGPGAVIDFRAMDVAPSGAVIVGGAAMGNISFDGHGFVAPEQQLAVMSVRGADASVEWAAGYRTTGPDGIIRDLAVDGAGDIVFTAYTSSLSIAGVDVNPVEGALELVAKVSASGEYRFAHDVVGTDLDMRVAADASGRTAITSQSYGSTLGFGFDELPLGGDDEMHRYVAVLDPDGVPLWGRALDLDLPPTNSYWPATTVAFDGDGNVLVEHANILTTRVEPERLSKYDPSGTLLWTQEVADVPTGVATDEGTMAADSLGNVVHTSGMRAPDAAAPPDGPGVGHDIIVRKLAPDGALIWTRVIDHDLEERAFDVAIAPDDTIWVGHGSFVGGAGTIRITKLAP